MKRMIRSLAVLSIIAPLIGCTGPGGSGSEDDGGFHGVLLDPTFEKPDFVLTDTGGEPFDFRARTDGKVALLFFGYTNCPDVCPIQMSNLASVLARFPSRVRDAVQVVFVTVDPDQDTPERLRAWLDNFDPAFIGLRGDTAEVKRIQGGLMMAPSLRIERDDGGHDMAHASQIVAFTADGAGRVLYPHGVRQEDWMHDIPRLVDFAQ